MKKFVKLFTSLCLVLLAGVMLAGCGLETKDGGTTVHNATITSWYEYENEKYLDTSVNINFDDVKITEVKKVTFELYNGDTLLGNAVSEGKNLEKLLKDCAQYWDKTADTYTEVTGDRIMSCAFKTRTESSDNGFWVRSKCTATESSVPEKLVVKVVVGNIEYVTSNVK